MLPSSRPRSHTSRSGCFSLAERICHNTLLVIGHRHQRCDPLSPLPSMIYLVSPIPILRLHVYVTHYAAFVKASTPFITASCSADSSSRLTLHSRQIRLLGHAKLPGLTASHQTLFPLHHTLPPSTSRPLKNRQTTISQLASVLLDPSITELISLIPAPLLTSHKPTFLDSNFAFLFSHTTKFTGTR